MSNPMDIGVEQGLISLDADQKNIIYTAQDKRLRCNDSEEKVRANAYHYGLVTEPLPA